MGECIEMAGFTDSVIGFFDRHLTQEDVRRFLVSEYQTIVGGKAAVGNLHSDLDVVGALLAKLGWINAENQQFMEEMVSISHVDAAELWMERLYGSHVISQGMVIVGAGKNLDILDSQSSREKFVRSEADLLLSHVENRRRKSLSQFSESLDEQQIFEERSDLTIFFSHYALRHNDLRFLNAVFKLNEWLMSAYRKVKDTQMRAVFLLSLAEQENSARGLLK